MTVKNEKNILNFPSSRSEPVMAHELKQKIKTLAPHIESEEDIDLETCKMTARSILETLNKKDAYTFEHSTRVAYFATLIAKELGLTEQQILELEFAALFHDIGKIGVPDSILKKPGRLTAEEYEEMKNHPVYSAEIIEHFKPFQGLALSVKHHHERFDGRGYPSGLKGEEIPLFSRMILVADTFDAMTSTRPYRKGLPFASAYGELMELAGTQFDPQIVKAFIRVMRKESQSSDENFYLRVLDKEFIKEAA